MNKFSLLFIAFVIFGGIVANDATVKSVDQAPQAHHGTEMPLAQNVEVSPTKIEEKVAAQVTAKKAEETSAAGQGNVVSTPAPVKKDTESTVDQIKVLFAAGLVKAQEIGAVVRHYLLGDILTNWLVSKKYIANANAELLTSYGTPRLLVNYAFAAALVAGTYYTYQALTADERDQDDFLLDLDEEDFE
jgi:hypothetical protein